MRAGLSQRCHRRFSAAGVGQIWPRDLKMPRQPAAGRIRERPGKQFGIGYRDAAALRFGPKKQGGLETGIARGEVQPRALGRRRRLEQAGQPLADLRQKVFFRRPRQARAADSPASRRCQSASGERPKGDSRPIPVTTVGTSGAFMRAGVFGCTRPWRRGK